MEGLTGIIGGLVIMWIIYKVLRRIEFLRKLKGFKGPKGWPILGNCLDLNVPREEVLKVFERWRKDYGGCLIYFIGMEPYVLVSDPKHLEKILSSTVVIEKGWAYKFFHRWLGLGLLTAGGKKWAHRRKQLTPAFHFKILEDFMKVFNEQCNTLKNSLGGKGNEIFDVWEVIALCTLDIICESVMGRKIDAQEKRNSDYVRANVRINEIVYFRHLRPWFYWEWVWRLSTVGREEKRCLDILHGLSEKVIKERKEERKKMGKDKKVLEERKENMCKKKRLAFLDLLLDAQEKDPMLSDLNIREEVDTFMFEGHDTTGAAVSWTTFLIGRDDKVQKKVVEELNSIFGEDKEREVKMEDLGKMKYLECCIKEGLRLFPSVPFLGRAVTEDLELAKGLVAPKGSSLHIFIYGLHRNEDIFVEADKFIPDRFLGDNAQGRDPFSYVPFSAGPRNCIGQKFAMMEEKVMLAAIFRNFRVEPVEEREEIPVLCEIITRAANGLKIRVRRR